jgi:putative ubiquitin-RnfH superfamily antitoxin RatB of RatAB toxin-antitoxin module
MFWSVSFIFICSINYLLASDSNENVERFINISKQMEKNFNNIVDYKTAKVIFLIRERTPYDQKKIDDANKLLNEHEQKLRKNREDFIKKNGKDNVVDDETFNKYLLDSRSRFYATLTTSERVYLSAYYYKEGKIREEELLFKDSRPLLEIANLLQSDPDSIKGMISYKVNDENYFSQWEIGTHPLDSIETEREEYASSMILDQFQSDKIRAMAELGFVRKFIPDNLQFLKFGNDFISSVQFEELVKKIKLPVSIFEYTEGNEKMLQCLFGRKEKKEACYEIDLYPEKHHAIKSMKLYYNEFVTLDYEFSQYRETKPNLWTPKHIILKNRILDGDVDDAFHVTEFLAVEPIQLGIELDNKLFEIHLTKQEKEEIEQKDEIEITRRAVEIPEELRQQKVEAMNDFWWRIVLLLIGLVFLFLAIYFRRGGIHSQK